MAKKQPEKKVEGVEGNDTPKEDKISYSYTIKDGCVVGTVPPLQVSYKNQELTHPDTALEDNRSLGSLIEFYGEDTVLQCVLGARRIALRKYLRSSIESGKSVNEAVNGKDALKSTRQPAGKKQGKVEFMASLAEMLSIRVDEFTPEQLAAIDAKFSK